MPSVKHVTTHEDGTITLNRAKLRMSKRMSALANKRGRPLKFTKKQIIEALQKSGGFKTRACKMLNCKLDTLNKYLNRFPVLARALQEIDEQYLDMAEYSLLKQVKKENTTATLFYLERKGKSRGYSNPRDVQAASQQFNQFNLGLPGGGTWLDLMNKAEKELQSQGKPTIIDLTPPALEGPVKQISNGDDQEKEA